MNRLSKTPWASVLLVGALTISQPGAADTPVFHSLDGATGLPFSDAVAYDDLLYLSGKLGTDATGKLVSGGITPETEQLMENIKATLARHKLDMADIIKCTVFLGDIGDWPAFNEVYRRYFEAGRFPARSALAASGLALGAAVEVECLAALDD